MEDNGLEIIQPTAVDTANDMVENNDVGGTDTDIVPNTTITKDEVNVNLNGGVEGEDIRVNEVKAEVKEEATPKVTDYGVYKNIDTAVEEIDSDRFISVPKMDITRFYKYASEVEKFNQDIYNNVKTAVATVANVTSDNTAVSGKTFTGLDYNNTVTEMVREGVTISPRTVNVNGGTKRDLVRNKLSKITKNGNTVQIPCENSGFQVTIALPENNALYAIRKEIREESLLSEINSGGFLFNNTKIKVIKRLLDFIFVNIVDTSLKVPEGKTVYDYIVPEDHPLLIMGTCYALYPNGNKTVITCKNTTVINNGVPKCNFTATADINVKDTFKVKEGRISNIMYDILARRKGGSVSIDDYNEYQKERLSQMVDDVITFTSENGTVKFYLKTTNINKYLARATRWADKMEVELYKLGDTEKDAREQTLNELIEINKLSTYSSYISKMDIDGIIIDMDNENELDDNLDILTDVLAEYSSDDISLNYFLEKLFNYISSVTIAGVAVNTFTCPTCNEKQTEDNELIWLDPITYFLEILDYRFISITREILM